MAYQAIARTWRPQTFNDVQGQDHITRTLSNAIRLSRIHHAYLFTGIRGVGKTSVARILTRCLNCEQGPTPEPCNECSFCTEILQGRSVDVLEIDGASNTGVDDVREIKEQIRYQPASARYKIFVIDEVHMLSNSAFNALLKTLEEPPDHALFILATTEVEKIPQTILSRCQRFDFKRIPFNSIVEKLKNILNSEDITISDSALFQIARVADGSMRDAESLIDQLLAYGEKEISDEQVKDSLGLLDHNLIQSLLQSLITRDYPELLSTLENCYQQGADPIHLSQELIQHLRNLAVIKVCGVNDAPIDLAQEEIDWLASIAQSKSNEDLQLLFQLLTRAYPSIARSPQPRMMLEMTLLKMSLAPDVQDIQSLLQNMPDAHSMAPEPKKKIKVVVGSAPTATAVPIKNVPLATSWEECTDRVRKHKPLLGSLLEGTKFIGMEGDKIKLEVAKDSVHFRSLKDPANIQLLGDLIQKFMGQAYTIQWLENEGEGFVSDGKVKQAEQDKQRKIKEQKVLQEKSVQLAQNVFNATVKEIKVFE